MQRAREIYRVAIDQWAWVVDEDETGRLRGEDGEGGDT